MLKTALPLDGKKTYIVAAAQALLFGAKAAGFITEELYLALSNWLSGAMGITVAHMLVRKYGSGGFAG
jgi:hypothetical protein